MTFSLCVGELTDLSTASAKSFASRTADGHDLYVYPREQADSASFETLRQAGVRICDAGAFYARPVRYEHPRWGGYAPFADVFRYTAMRRLGTPWVDLDSLLLDPGNIPLGPFVASEHVRYQFPARTKGLFDAAGNIFYAGQPIKEWFKAAREPSLITNSHFFLPDGPMLRELCRRFPLSKIPSLKSGNYGMTLLGEEVRRAGATELLAHPDVFNPIQAKASERFQAVLRCEAPLPESTAVLHIFRIARERMDPSLLGAASLGGFLAQTSGSKEIWTPSSQLSPSSEFLSPAGMLSCR